MARILFGWELGDGLGHVMRLRPLARRLAALGHACLFAVRSPVNAVHALDDDAFPILQAPYTQPSAPPEIQKQRIASFGDVLGTVGFVEPDRLGGLVRAWDDLVRVCGVDLVVADFAPTLCLAVYGTVPHVVIGDGFTLPPPELPGYPRFRDSEPRVPERDLMATVRAVQEARGRPAPPTMPALMSGTRRFVVTLQELDTYARHRSAPAVGPLEPLPVPDDRAPEEDFFAYLSTTYAATERAVSALLASGLCGSFYLRDCHPRVREALRRKGATLHETPPPLAEVVPRVRFVVHHGGLGTSEKVLALGRPQLLVPRHMEQTLNARALGRFKVGVMMASGSRFQEEHVLQAVKALTTSTDFATNAMRLARQLAARTLAPATDTVASACVGLLAGERTGS